MGGSRRLAIGLWARWASCALFALVLLFRPVDAQALQPAVTVAPGNYVGVATCGGTTCHGRSQGDGPRRPPGRDHAAGRTRPPPPARTAALMRSCASPRSQRDRRAARHRRGDRRADVPRLPRHPGRPARRAASRPPTASAANPATARRSGWLASHYAVGGTHAANVAQRHGPARQSAGPRRPAASTAISAAPTENQFVTHRIMAAGHPRISLRARPVLHAAAALHESTPIIGRAQGPRPATSRSGRSARRWRWSARSRLFACARAAARASSPNSISSTATPATAGSRDDPRFRADRGRQSRAGRSRRACRPTMTRT